MISYISILIASIIAFISLIFKTTKEQEGSHIKTMTPSGIILLCLLFLSLSFGIIRQSKDDSNKKIQLVRDSINMSYKSRKDSVRFNETIENFRKQRVLDSNQLNDDSLHFLNTLDAFSTQLKAQHQTLNQINNLLHPLFPMNIYSQFRIKLDSLSKEQKSQLQEVLHKIVEVNSNKDGFYEFPNDLEFFIKNNEVVSMFGHFANDGRNDTSVYNKPPYSKLFDLITGYIPSMTIIFLKNSSLPASALFNERNIDLFITPYGEKFTFRYSSKEIIFTSNVNILPKDVDTKNQIISIKQCLHDLINISLSEQSGIVFNYGLDIVFFHLGESYFHSYVFFPSKGVKSDNSGGSFEVSYKGFLKNDNPPKLIAPDGMGVYSER